MLKKQLVFLLCLLFLVLSLSACETQKPEENQSSLTETKEDVSIEHTREEAEETETNDNSEPLPETPSVPEIPPDAWKEAYLALLETMKDYHRTYALVYVDNDDIPELYLNGDCEATGDGVYSYINGKVVEQRLRRTWGGRYIERGGWLYNHNGNMGCYSTHVFKLTTEGFSQTFSSLVIENLEQWVNNEPVLSYDYFVEDVPVSEIEYNNARNAAFDYARSIPFHQNAVTYDVIKEQIQSF